MLFGKNIDVESYLLFSLSMFVQAHALRRYWSLCAFAPAQSPVRSPFTRRERMEPWVQKLWVIGYGWEILES